MDSRNRYAWKSTMKINVVAGKSVDAAFWIAWSSLAIQIEISGLDLAT